MMVLKEVLFLKAAFPRLLHSKDPQGPEAEVTPIAGVGFRVTVGTEQNRTQIFH